MLASTSKRTRVTLLHAGLAAALLALAACQTAPSRGGYQPHDARVVGTWVAVGNDYFDLPNVALSRGEKTYFADGTACGYNLDVEKDGSVQLDVFKDNWEIKDGRLYSTVLASNADYLKPGQLIVDDLVSVDGKVLRLHDVDEPKAPSYARYKLPADQGDQLCQLFAAVMSGRAAPGSEGP